MIDRMIKMKYPFSAYKMKVDNHVFWVTESDLLKGCVAQGDTILEAVIELEENEIEWLKTAKMYGIKIPKEEV
jgi:predicted RNase H-like HicB family nuclease